jgi:preprotein translocase subunit SecG
MTSTLYSILIVIHVLVAAGLIAIILLQHGKGADAGAAFGSGASATVFGSRGSSSFFSRFTGLLAAVFFITSLTLFWLNIDSVKPTSVTETVEPPVVTQPAETTPGDVPTVPEEASQAAGTDMPTAPDMPAVTDVPSVDTPVEAADNPAETVPAMPADVPSTQ